MTTSLYWRPMSKQINGLSDELKFALRKRYDDVGATGIMFDASHIPWLQGLEDAGVEDAKKVIEAIEKHDEVMLWES